MPAVDPHTPSGLVEIELPSVPLRIEWRHAVKNFALVVVAVLGFLVLIPPHPSGAIAFLVVYSCACIAVSRLLNAGEKRVFQHGLCSRADASSFIGAIAACVQARPSTVPYVAEPAVCLKLVDLGGGGTTLRIGPPDPAPVVPFAEPFEARLLDARDPAFVHLAASVGVGTATPPAPWVAFISALWSRFGPVIVLAAIFALPVARSLLAVVTFDAGLRGILIVAAGGVVVGLGYRLLAGVFATRWLVVPGGVVLRRIPLWGPIDVYRLDRRMSVLIAVAFNQRWQVAVADGSTTAKRTMDTRELDILLRAWLSPIPPPAPETLSDLQ